MKILFIGQAIDRTDALITDKVLKTQTLFTSPTTW